MYSFLILRQNTVRNCRKKCLIGGAFRLDARSCGEQLVPDPFISVQPCFQYQAADGALHLFCIAVAPSANLRVQGFRHLLAGIADFFHQQFPQADITPQMGRKSKPAERPIHTGLQGLRRRLCPLPFLHQIRQSFRHSFRAAGLQHHISHTQPLHDIQQIIADKGCHDQSLRPDAGFFRFFQQRHPIHTGQQ